MKEPVVLFWFRRDLRLHDNAGLFAALSSGLPVVPVFIFDRNILDKLDKEDKRVNFIYNALQSIQASLQKVGAMLDVRYGFPAQVFSQLIKDYDVQEVYTNHDYEPYATERDGEIKKLLAQKNIAFKTYKDSVIFERNEVVKDDGTPYSIYTPYYKKWIGSLTKDKYTTFPSEGLQRQFLQQKNKSLPSLSSMGFLKSDVVSVAPFPDKKIIQQYHLTRNTPSVAGTSKMGVHLRFGTISIRQLLKTAIALNETFVKELVWREFFMQLLWHQPRLQTEACKKEYDNIQWRNNEQEFARWCNGQTGYPIVDAGMRELNATGFMHNRVRMIVASFLVKDLLIDWRWGEAYFAQKLYDYDLASNNGNWQWVAGCGCDAAPYFRIFNPALQAKKFDAQQAYIQQWVPEYKSEAYPPPIVDHAFAAQRCLQAYKKALALKQRTQQLPLHFK